MTPTLKDAETLRRSFFRRRISIVVVSAIIIFLVHASLILDRTDPVNKVHLEGLAGQGGAPIPPSFHTDLVLAKTDKGHLEQVSGNSANEVQREDVSDLSVNKVQDVSGQGEPPSLPSRYHSKPHTSIYGGDVAANLSSAWTKEMADRRRQVFQSRSQTLKANCKAVSHIPGFFPPKMKRIHSNLRWVRDHHFIWCPIFKSASTTWVKYLLLLAGETSLNHSLHGRAKELYPQPSDPREMREVLLSSMKIIIVRHPLERLLSAYRDKMFRAMGACDPFLKMQKAIMDKYKDPNGDPPPKSNITVGMGVKASACMADYFVFDKSKWPVDRKKWGAREKVKVTFPHPTFSQFLYKVRDDLKEYWKKQGFSQVNLHWRPYWTTCGPCEMDYDVIAQVETLGEDQEYIIRELGLENVLINAHTHASRFDGYNGTSNSAHDYFRQVPRSLLQEITNYYKPDFDLFGYSPEPYLSLTKEFG